MITVKSRSYAAQFELDRMLTASTDFATGLLQSLHRESITIIAGNPHSQQVAITLHRNREDPR